MCKVSNSSFFFASNFYSPGSSCVQRPRRSPLIFLLNAGKLNGAAGRAQRCSLASVPSPASSPRELLVFRSLYSPTQRLARFLLLLGCFLNDLYRRCSLSNTAV